MATTFYLFGGQSGADETPPGSLSADDDHPLSLGVRDSANEVVTTSTVAGPTSGKQVTNGVAGAAISWWSAPLSAVTISGTITFNVWMAENNMSANVGAQVILDRVDGSGTFISTIVNSEMGTEIPVTTRAAQNWTAAPTSTTLANGDRIRCRVLGNDGGGTQASGFTFNLASGATSGGVDGDSFVTFTETITEFTAAPERVPRFTPYPQLLAH